VVGRIRSVGCSHITPPHPAEMVAQLLKRSAHRSTEKSNDLIRKFNLMYHFEFACVSIKLWERQKYV
jgi:hypothetical protein